jgi:hypothetical protein
MSKMPSKEDGERRSNDGDHTSKGPGKGVDNVALADTAAREKVNPWSKGMLSVGVWAG